MGSQQYNNCAEEIQITQNRQGTTQEGFNHRKKKGKNSKGQEKARRKAKVGLLRERSHHGNPT